MKKYILLLAITFFCFACISKRDKKDTENKGILTVSIEPQRFLLERLVGDLFTVRTVLPPDVGPEMYEPAPNTMIDLGKSAIYFIVGDLGFEKRWTKSLSKNNPSVKIVNCSQDIQRIVDTKQAHNHLDLRHQCHANGDPHVWSSPKEMLAMARVMYETMKAYDAKNEPCYSANFQRLTSLIKRTDSTIRQHLASVPSQSFVIYHPTLGYFARDYGLRQLSIEMEGKNPSSMQMKHLLDDAKKANVHTVFVQKAFDMKNGEVVAKELGATVYIINPLAYEWDKELIRISSILARTYHE